MKKRLEQRYILYMCLHTLSYVLAKVIKFCFPLYFTCIFSHTRTYSVFFVIIYIIAILITNVEDVTCIKYSCN